MKRFIVALVLCLAMVAVMVTPTMAAPATETGSCVGTEVIKCPEGYGHIVCHYNVHWVEKCGPDKLDIHLQGQKLLKTCEGTEVCNFNLNLVMNMQAGEYGVYNGQVKINCCGCDLHVIGHYANGHCWIKIVPVETV